MQVRFLVMGNVLPSDIRLHRRYDLKGSTYKRTVGAEVAAANPEAVLKDLDVDMKVRPRGTRVLVGFLQGSGRGLAIESVTLAGGAVLISDKYKNIA